MFELENLSNKMREQRSIITGFSESIMHKILRLSPSAILVASFLLSAGLGTLLLWLPLFQKRPVAFVDALFIAVSAVCVTGLATIDIYEHFNFLGQFVILVLIQLGGVGIMTCSVALFHMLGQSICHRDRVAVQSTFGFSKLQSIGVLVRSVFLLSIGIEVAGAAILFLCFANESTFFSRVWSAVFHSVSAFCNAGFSLYSDSLVQFRGHYALNATVCSLIILGGIGFPVLLEVRQRFFRTKDSRQLFTVQTKSILFLTIVLNLFGLVALLSFESATIWQEFGTAEGFLACLFQSITSRTAGFNTIDISQLSEPSLLTIMVLMLIGAAPGSCAGGIKVTTVAVLLAIIYSKLRKQNRPSLFYRSIPEDTILRSMSLCILAVVTILCSVFVLLIEEHFHGAGRDSVLLIYLFESISAFATVGLSIGGTAGLSFFGKLWIAVLMFTGRVGIFALSYTIVGGVKKARYFYAEEPLMIG